MKLWRNKRFKIVGVVVGIVILAALFFVMQRFKNAEQLPTETRMNTVRLSKMNLTNSISATGTLESEKTKTVRATVSNVTVEKVNVKVGEDVKKGQKLVTFDEKDLRNSLKEAKENLSDTQSQIRINLASANRKLEDAKENYQSQKKKYAANISLAKEEYEMAKKAFSVAKTKEEKEKEKQTLNQAKKSYEQAKSEQVSGNRQNENTIQSAKEQLLTTKSNNKKLLREANRQLTNAKEALEGCSVTAPISGTVTFIGVEDGDMYQGGTLLEISDCTKMHVSTSVDEYDIAKVSKGQKVAVLLDATGEEELYGTITYVAKTPGSSSSTSGLSSNSSMTNTGNSSATYEVQIQLESENDKLRIGMTARCSILLEEVNDVFAVPYDAVSKNRNGDTVLFVMDKNGERSEIVVTKGMESDYYVEVSGDGLEENMEVIIPTDTKTVSDESFEESKLENIMGGSMNPNRTQGGRPNFAPGSSKSAPNGAPRN